MRKNLKKVVGCMAAMAFLVTSIVPFSVRANTAQNPYEFSYATGFNGYLTSAVAKQNDSSGFIKCTDASLVSSQGTLSGAAFYATMYGSTTSTGTFSNLVYNGNSSTTYRVYDGSQTYMINYVNESGGKYAKIKGVSAGGSYVKFTGYWKADTK